MKRIVLSVFLVASLASSASSASRSDINIPDLTEILAKDFQVVTLEGETIPFSALIEGGRPVVLEFWATWCIPCRKTLPHLVELRAQHADSVVIVGLTVEDPAEDGEKVQNFVAKHHVNFQIAFAPAELFQFMNDRDDIAVPKLFVFDGAGRLDTYIPRYSPFTPRRLRAAVKKVLSHD